MSDIPLKEGLFHIPQSSDEKPYLIGSRCKVCGYVCFPAKSVCVRCQRDDTMEKIQLGPYGTLETYTVMRVGTSDFSAPYIMGYVRTKEGASIFTLITGCDISDDALEIGSAMELVIEKVRVDERGNNLLGWKFKPVAEKSK